MYTRLSESGGRTAHIRNSTRSINKPISIDSDPLPNMANALKLSFTLLVSISLLLPLSSAAVVCENLSERQCSFAISSTGRRCVLESSHKGKGKVEYQCRTSDVIVNGMAGLVETDQCVKACGVDRHTVGISSDYLLDAKFVNKLCSPPCYHSCHNIVDLYFNLAAGEGVFLPDLCKAAQFNPRRSMVELMSSGATMASSPAPSPSA